MHFAAGMLDIVARPLQRPLVLRAQLGKAQPVLKRGFRVIRNLHCRLQRRTDQRHAAKRPQRQTTETFGRITIDQRHGLAGTQGFQRGDKASQTATGHQHIRGNELAHERLPSCLLCVASDEDNPLACLHSWLEVP